MFSSSQTSRLLAQQESLENALNEKIENEIGDVKQDLRFSVEELSRIITEQQTDIQEEINLLKSGQSDFSGIVQDSVKGVVSVTTDKSAGSGFIVHPGGYIVTNWHVIDGGQIYRATTSEGITLDAEFIGADTFTDLALLKIPGLYNSLELDASDEVQVGEKVIAIGNPLGLSFSVTEGIVSAVDRVGPNGLEAYIQTDVTLNPGNSGGPLINRNGKVIGVNNFKIGGAESLGFSLESDVVRHKINEIANMTVIE